MRISKRIFTALIVALLSISVSAVAYANHQTGNADRLEAEKLWEAMIAARGGRERLHAVTNVQMSEHEKYWQLLRRLEINYEGMFVFPNKAWEWDDQKGTVFGMSVRLNNFETNTHLSYVDAGHGARVTPIINPSDRNLVRLQLHLFGETRWVRPVPQRTRLGKLDNRELDVVEVRIDELPPAERKVEFWLDRQSHLPVQVVYYSTIKSRELSGAVPLSKYVEVNGIKIPGQIGRVRAKYQLNVEYDPRVFEQPPGISAGMNAWQKK
jgi:hypothetical protein